MEIRQTSFGIYMLRLPQTENGTIVLTSRAPLLWLLSWVLGAGPPERIRGPNMHIE